jgi:pimeloyl-ACP methyl ester carboxylesterase
MCWIDELQRMSTSAEVLIAARDDRTKTDVTDLLAEIMAPTLVLHSRRDKMIDYAEARLLASSVPGARTGDTRQRQPHPAVRRTIVERVHGRGHHVP